MNNIATAVEHFEEFRGEGYKERLIEILTYGRQVILKYRRGGRIPRDYVYDSADDHDAANIAGVLMSMSVAGTKDDIGYEQLDLGPHLIGRGVIGLAPWETRDFTEAVINGMTAEQKLRIGTPMRVSDVVEQPGTVIIFFESA